MVRLTPPPAPLHSSTTPPTHPARSNPVGTQDARTARSPDDRRAYTQALLKELRALERLIEEGHIESGVSRIGAEQELVLVGHTWRPAPVADKVLEHLDDPRFTTELGRFNIEYNADPRPFQDRCLHHLERDLAEAFNHARGAAHRAGAEAIMTGILPSLERKHLHLDYLTDMPRYHALNEAIMNLRGSHHEIRIKGAEELTLNHNNIMTEAANTSFQVHFQVSPEHFVTLYNAAQAALGPVVAAAANSPLLLGRRLWAETRIALFQQSIDTRRVRPDDREFQPRVSFGTDWVRRSATELFQQDIARFRPLFALDPREDPLKIIDRGETPSLDCLKLFNSTIYRWNRACYGISEGVPHIRIENRVLPSGPTTVDQVASAALWFGLIRAIADEYGDIAEHMAFDHAHANFIAAAQHGLEAQLRWPGLGAVPARELIPLKILPLARRGLEASGIDPNDSNKYLHIIERRAATGQNGAAWAADSLHNMHRKGTRGERMAALTAAISLNQTADIPIHDWPLAQLDHPAIEPMRLHTVGQFMTTELFTVHESDVIDLVVSLMDWQHLRHIPVEDDDHKLVGLVSHRALLRHVSKLGPEDSREPIPVSDVMESELTTVSPDTTTIEALSIMHARNIGCLPVVHEDRTLAGIVTEHDFFEIATPLLTRYLADTASDDTPPTPRP